jgi:hypothetical protein
VSSKAQRRAARARAAAGIPEKRVEIKGDPAFFRRINYKAVGAGFVVAAAVYLVFSILLAAPGGVTNSSFAEFFGVSAVAMYAGGLTAGMIEPKYGVLNGPLVAVVFIFVSFVLTFVSEIQQVKVVGPLGLGPMRVDKVFATDLPQLFFSSLGGLTAGMIDQRFRRPGGRDQGGRPNRGPGSQG